MKPNVLRAALLAVLSALAILAASCGGDSSSDEAADLGPDPATMAPSDAPFYAEVVVRPQGSLGDDLNSALSKLLGQDDPGASVREMLDQALASDSDSNGATYTNDIEPWLGARAGIFVSGIDPKTSNPDAAAVVSVTDPNAAQAFIDKVTAGDSTVSDQTYAGVAYKATAKDDSAIGVAGDFMIAGNQQGFKDAIDASSGEALADNADATAALDAAPDNSLFSLYVDTPAIVDLIKSSGQIPAAQLGQIDAQLQQLGDGPIDVWGTVTDSTFGIGASAPSSAGAAGPSDLVEGFPADSWLAFAAANFGTQLQKSVDQFSSSFQAGFESAAPKGLDAAAYDPLKQLEAQTGIDLSQDLSWIGDAGGFLQGTSVLGLGGALVLESTDDAAATEAIDGLGKALAGNPQLSGQVQVTPSATGFKLQAAGAPIGAEVAVQDGKVVVAAGATTIDDALSPDGTLAGSDRFATATGSLPDGATPSFFLDFAPLVSLIESSGQATGNPDYEAAKPYLDALDYLVSGSSLEGDRTVAELVLGVRAATGSDQDATAAAITP